MGSADLSYLNTLQLSGLGFHFYLYLRNEPVHNVYTVHACIVAISLCEMFRLFGSRGECVMMVTEQK